jgi:type I site-specific restriction-modification system R (restriction) subunit
LVGFVNPDKSGLVVVELKKPGVPPRAAFDENLTHYKQQIPALFWFNALLIASNGTDSRVGSRTADWGRFFEWKRIEREDEPRRVSLDTRPAPELSADERSEVKKVAKLLLERIKALLVLDWRKRQSSRAHVEDAIKDLLDTGLPRVYSPELYQKKCSVVFEHVYESYPERDAGVYTMAS